MRFLLVVLFIWGCSTLTPDEQTVYVTKSGKKYHEKSCFYLNDNIQFIALSKAWESGFTGCKVCHPTASITSQIPLVDSTKYNSNDVAETVAKQCAAISQKTGIQCKRRTKNKTGVCWQHK